MIPLRLIGDVPQPELSGGTAYWRTLDEYAETPAFRELVEREFPAHAAEWSDPISRRRFLSLMGASLALAGASGCTVRAPAEKLIPYVRQPEQLTPGKSLFFATAMPFAGGAVGLLVESHEGRPTKVEGNPLHPSSRGATDAFAQASILTLYDPDRSQALTYTNRIRGWNEALSELQRVLKADVQPNRGRKFRILTETITSPTLAAQLEDLIRTFPEGRWHQYEPTLAGHAHAAARAAFGEVLDVQYDFTKADVIVTLDADVFGAGPGRLRYARDFAARRRIRLASDSMNRHYAVESMPTGAGMAADHRLPVRAGQVATLARALAARLGVLDGNVPLPADIEKFVATVAKDVSAAPRRGRTVIVPGSDQPAAVHALAHALNDRLGNLGQTVMLTQPVATMQAGAASARSLDELCADIDANGVDVLLILGGNPVYSTPADVDFLGRLQKVPLRIHHSLYNDETSQWCHWHIPAAHYLESWSDARGHDGTAAIMQPLIAPLYAGRSAHDVLAAFSARPNRPAYEIVRDHWRKYWDERKPGGSFEEFWRQAIHDGIVAGTAFAPRTPTLGEGWRALAAETQGEPFSSAAPEKTEIIFRPDPTVYDGRFANNGWLQELPKPVTKLTWDNAAHMSPAMAARLGVKNAIGPHGGGHGETIADTVHLQFQGRSVENVPVLIVPGHPDGSVTLHTGYGRSRAGRVGNGTGVNANALRTRGAAAYGTGLSVERTGRTTILACTSLHHLLRDEVAAKEAERRGRGLVRTGRLTEYQDDPASLVAKHGAHDGPLPSVGGLPQKPPAVGSKPLDMYPAYPYDGYKWGMVIDLAACIGCSGCVVACQAENNIPVVGKEQVTRGREMHWLRIDQYFAGNAAHPETYYQPMMCVHCENAPCEVVCPVEATSHSTDGLNEMTYNRCVGTRYCSNNCPYKVRRFNFFQYSDYATASLKLMRNPDVTVRSRGVMEKCTFCVQQIREAEIEAKNQNRHGEDPARPNVAVVRDGEILTACQAACPTQAIVFGDMNDRGSEVAKLKQDPRHFGVLSELNTRPRLTYLAAVRNPHEDLILAKPGADAHGH